MTTGISTVDAYANRHPELADAVHRAVAIVEERLPPHSELAFECSSEGSRELLVFIVALAHYDESTPRLFDEIDDAIRTRLGAGASHIIVTSNFIVAEP